MRSRSLGLKVLLPLWWAAVGSQVVKADDGPIVCIDLQTSSTPNPGTITSTYTGAGPTVYAFLVVTEIPGDRVSGVSVGFDLSTDGSVTKAGFTLLEDWDASSENAYGFDPEPEGPGETVPTAIGYWTLELSEGSSSTATLSLVAPGGVNGEAILIVDGERRGYVPSEARHAGINASAPSATIGDPLHEYLSVRQHHVLMQSLGQNLVMPEGLIGAPLEAFTQIDSTLRAALLPYEPVRIDKVFRRSSAERDSILVLSDGYHLRMPELWKIVKVTVTDSSYVDSLIADLDETGATRFAETNSKGEFATTVPDDPRLSDQWHLENDGAGPCLEDSDIDATTAWDISVGDPDVLVAIVDSGIYRDHEDLQGRTILGDIAHGVACGDTVKPYHGTYVAGAFAAATDNSTGIAAVDWNCTLLSKCVNSDVDTVAAAIYEAADAGADIINLSLAWVEGMHDSTEPLRQALLSAFYRGATPVAAAGNWNVQEWRRFPAAYPNVVGVGWLGCFDNLKFSAHNGWLDVVAPGDILTLEYLDPDAYVVAGGTSLACPIVSGIASLVMSIDRGLNPPLHDMDVQRILELTAVDLGAQGFDSLSYGACQCPSRTGVRHVEPDLE